MQINNIFNVGADGCNAYLITGEKCALIGGVPEEHSDELIRNIKKAGADKLDYVIFNHASPRQAGALEKLISLNPNITVIGTVAAIRNIGEFIFTDFCGQIAKNGSLLDLGEKTLEFHIAPNMPWPDTMLIYLKEDKILFSGEMFSQSSNSAEAFYDERLRQFGGFVRKGLEKIKQLNVCAVFPAHGAVLDNIPSALRLYEEKLAEHSRGDYAVLCYATEFGYTYEMARIIAEALEQSGINVKIFNAEESGGEMLHSLRCARALIFGTPTINRNAPPKIWEAVCGLDGAAQRGIPCMTFGAYGWSGDAPLLIHTHLRAMNFRMFEKPFTSVFRLKAEEKARLVKYAERFGKFITDTENNSSR